jgi:hypothetical protein
MSYVILEQVYLEAMKQFNNVVTLFFIFFIIFFLFFFVFVFCL